MSSSDLPQFRSRRDLSTLVNNPSPEIEKNQNADIWRVYQSQHNVNQSSGDTFQVIAQPDCRFPLISWIFSITSVFSTTNYRDDAYASPPSLMAYTFLLYYALMYFLDIYVSPYPSSEAQRIQNQQEYQMLLENLLSLPVPDFADEFFLKLQPFQDALATNLHFLSTLGTADPEYDFGRLFPVNSFLQLHNALATSPANISLEDLLKKFYYTVVCRFGTSDYTNGQLYGAVKNNSDDPNTTQRFHQWLNQRVERLVSTSSVRTMMSRVAFGNFIVEAPTYRDRTDFSVYDFVMGLTSVNYSQHMLLINHLAPFVRDNFPRSKNLANYVVYGTPSIVRHLISGPTLPTWHTLDAPKHPSNMTFAPIPSPPSEFARATRFMITKPDVQNNIPANKQEQVVLPNAVPGGNLRPTLRIEQVADQTHPGATKDREPDSWTLFDQHSHYQPQMLIFDPADSNPAAHGITTLGGHIIEKSEICGIGLPLPTPQSNLLHVNTMYMNGAILKQKLKKAITSWFATTTPTAIDYDNVPLAVFLKTMSYIRIPLFRTGLVETSDHPAGSFARLFPTMGVLPPSAPQNRVVRRVSDSYTVVSSTTRTDTLIDDGTIYLWSSYRVAIRDQKTLEEKVYFLPTLNHIYGQRIRFMTTHFPALLIP